MWVTEDQSQSQLVFACRADSFALCGEGGFLLGTNTLPPPSPAPAPSEGADAGSGALGLVRGAVDFGTFDVIQELRAKYSALSLFVKFKASYVLRFDCLRKHVSVQESAGVSCGSTLCVSADLSVLLREGSRERERGGVLCVCMRTYVYFFISVLLSG